MMEYKGYLGKVEYDDEADIFHGEVINLRDVITFQGESVQELRKAFQAAVEDYLAFCTERGEEPERPYSGVFTVRIPPALHRDVALRARLQDKSLNSWVAELLEVSLTEPPTALPRESGSKRLQNASHSHLLPRSGHTDRSKERVGRTS
jgi:predicted HicB family RNase H-like nuclease